MILKRNGPLKTLGFQAAQLVTSLHEDNRAVFRLEEVGRILGLKEPSARSLVRKLVNGGSKKHLTKAPCFTAFHLTPLSRKEQAIE